MDSAVARMPCSIALNMPSSSAVAASSAGAVGVQIFCAEDGAHLPGPVLNLQEALLRQALAAFGEIHFLLLPPHVHANQSLAVPRRPESLSPSGNTHPMASKIIADSLRRHSGRLAISDLREEVRQHVLQQLTSVHDVIAAASSSGSMRAAARSHIL
jgi:hypothetical protein